MIEVMMFLTVAPVIGLGLALIVMAIISFTSGEGTEVTPVEFHLPEGTPKDVPQTKEPNPTIAEQFDGRLTNILRSPMEGIL